MWRTLIEYQITGSRICLIHHTHKPIYGDSSLGFVVVCVCARDLCLVTQADFFERLLMRRAQYKISSSPFKTKKPILLPHTDRFGKDISNRAIDLWSNRNNCTVHWLCHMVRLPGQRFLLCFYWSSWLACIGNWFSLVLLFPLLNSDCLDYILVMIRSWLSVWAVEFRLMFLLRPA